MINIEREKDTLDRGECAVFYKDLRTLLKRGKGRSYERTDNREGELGWRDGKKG